MKAECTVDFGMFEHLREHTCRHLLYDCELICTASRSLSAVVNTSFEFSCSPECTSNVSWSYVSPESSAPYFGDLSVPACMKDSRCHTSNNTEMSLLIIDQVQFGDAGTYLCSTGTNKPNLNCEMSFEFTGTSYLYEYKCKKNLNSLKLGVRTAW